jgi:hypothetical protein
VLALLPAAAAVQLHAEAAAPPHAEAVGATESTRRAEAAGVELPLHAEAAVVVAPLRAEAAGAELTRHVEAAAVPLRAEAVAVAVELPLHAEAAVAELTRRAEAAVLAAPLHAEAVALLPAAAAVQLHAEAAVGAELTRRAEAAYAPRGQVTVRQEAYDCREASRCSLQGRLLRPWCPATAHREAHDCPEWSGRCLDRVSHLYLPARCRSPRRRRHRHDDLAARSRQPAYPDARRQRRHRSIAPGVW